MLDVKQAENDRAASVPSPHGDLGGFWAAAFGTDLDEDLWFQRVPERRTAKNRLHLDLRAPEGDIPAEVRRLEALGASVLGRHEQIVIMADPEGNEFCVE